jgi:2-iminobutanoate/2-iminopropanoate deaminase
MSQNKPLISRFVKTKNLVFLAGLTAKGENAETQIKNVFERIKATLEEAGSSMENVVKATVYLTDLNDRGLYLNDLWREYFPDNPPARTCVQAGLAPGTYVEIETIATLE